MTERNLEWMTAVIAIFKAGGVYMPVEPSLPTARIEGMLARAECELVLTERDIEAALRWGLDDAGDLGLDVASDQLAYIYFTSGSTGEPKGAMCEHAGMLNHLYAKIDDLGLREGDMVAQTAPQSFDISLWQLVSALLVGGRTLIVEQELILDIDAFLDKVAAERVERAPGGPVLPRGAAPHLDELPRELPDLRCVSVTGEALTKALAERWFALRPRRPPGERLRAHRDLGRHQPRGDDRSAGVRPGPARASRQQRARLRRRRAPLRRAARRARRDRVLGRLRRPRLRQRSGAHRGAPSSPTPTARASGSTAAATSAGGGRTASSSSSAGGTPR